MHLFRTLTSVEKNVPLYPQKSQAQGQEICGNLSSPEQRIWQECEGPATPHGHGRHIHGMPKGHKSVKSKDLWSRHCRKSGEVDAPERPMHLFRTLTKKKEEGV